MMDPQSDQDSMDQSEVAVPDQSASDAQDQPAPDNQDPTSQTGDQGPAADIRQQAQGQINQTIDQVAGRVPGGAGMSQQAKDAASGGLDSLEQSAKDRLGGLFGNKP